ncbi:DNA-directed RNA polymerase subunit delta [Robertmurraya kyonggiensis]|uniref:Probable DNA-directed RNA polymerase subunit delta n=1 Tax=Robertmurraya kyonggiensis TaxID=1037680 RepID=A0A4U1D3K8_9BACI|nr:DNA-directed RNA polymerase subunit delta [Robertmurraya kyonggiensis]TKC16901.1 DNA-directed RNA polymerase subunit delta [Robertmurraya kyonggiensis]
MSLKQFTQEQLQEMSLIEMAYEMLKNQKQPASFKEIMDEITATIGLSEEEVRAKIAQFYTDLNIDGRFLSLGENRWGLRVWYPVEQSEEEVITPTKPKKKKAKKVVDEDDDLELDYDDEDDIDYDDILDEDDEDDDDLLDLDDEDLDEDEDFEDEDEDLLEDDDEFEELDEDLDSDDEEDL